jgi:predicted ATP-dependent endonuclease of OLD family
MELVSVTIKSWKRFKQRVNLQTNGKLVALLGANEAGKSSILSALEFLDSERNVEQSEISRGSEAADVEIVGYFALSAEDQKRAGLSIPTRAVLTKKASGIATFELQPKPTARDRSLREKTLNQGQRIAEHKKATEILSDELLERIAGLLNNLVSTKEDLTSEVLGEIKQLSTDWKTLTMGKAPKFFQEFGDALSSLHEFESKQNPGQFATASIRGTFPSILLFDQAYRNLAAEYTADSLKSSIPLAFGCLASIARLDIPKLIALIEGGNAGDIETVRARANRTLKSKFQRFWKQSRVWPVLVINGGLIQVLIENEGDQFTALAERSDGLRQFVALQSFAMREQTKSPILLIDEADTHLHYDAQADLVQMLYRQEVANKVIYTTHSAGCLPEDLGNGVRLVKPRAEPQDESMVVNRFWGASDNGYSPLLIGMGASTLAFFPTRKALQVEGEGEMLLLPTLLRESLGESVLGFQVVPGLSKANKSQLPVAANGFNNIHYMVDGDGGGSALRRELIRNKIEEQHISTLSLVDAAECQLEDIIDVDLLVSATNKIVTKFSPGGEPIDRTGVPPTGKFKVLERKFKKATGKELQKIDLAYELLTLASDDHSVHLIDKQHSAKFIELAEEIMTKFYPEWERKS